MAIEKVRKKIIDSKNPFDDVLLPALDVIDRLIGIPNEDEEAEVMKEDEENG
jgi:hypothetical protein